MSKSSNTAKAIQADRHANNLFIDGTHAAITESNPNTCAERHVAKLAERLIAQSEFVKHIADYFGKKSMEE